MRRKYSGRLLISASATVGALLLVALMCFWGCFLYKRFGKNDKKGLAKDVGRGTVLYNFIVLYSVVYLLCLVVYVNSIHSFFVLAYL